jgi:division protein CdvB (Snf7/Vps24/ESCRT-III family)
MVTDTLEGLEDVEGINEEEVEGEVDAILTEITGGKLGQVGKVPENLPAEPEIAVEPQRDEQADADEEMLDQMRERLKALQS